MSDVIFTVADDACYGKPLDILCTLFPVAINNVVDCTLVVLLENVGIENILALRGDIPEGMKFPDGRQWKEDDPATGRTWMPLLKN